jgi:hypothetical protein
MEKIWDFIPGWVRNLIREGKARYGGGMEVKTPPRMKGLDLVSVSVPDRHLCKVVEKEAKRHGWTPVSYHRWDSGPSGTITFCETEHESTWRDFWEST